MKKINYDPIYETLEKIAKQKNVVFSDFKIVSSFELNFIVTFKSKTTALLIQYIDVVNVYMCIVYDVRFNKVFEFTIDNELGYQTHITDLVGGMQ